MMLLTALCAAMCISRGSTNDDIDLFDPPFRLSAGAEWIDVDHPAPMLYDWNGDGVDDLLIGEFQRGHLHIHRGIEASGEKAFQEKYAIFHTRRGLGAVPTGCCVGFGPQVADVNGDGFVDVVSGSLDGGVYFFAGARDGAHEEPIRLRDASGSIIGRDDYSTVALHDFDDDGHQDLLVGDYRGRVWFHRNLRGKGVPRFGLAQALRAGDGVLGVDGEAGPTIADWDGDGLADVICGEAAGGVWFFRNVGLDGSGRPEFAAGVSLIPSLTQEQAMAAFESRVEDREGHKVVSSGCRAKPLVADWNGDGCLDLIVGSVHVTWGVQPDLTVEDFAERDRLNERHRQVTAKYSELEAILDARIRQKMGIDLDTELNSEQRERWAAIGSDLWGEVDGLYETVVSISEIETRLADYGLLQWAHGWIWVYIRKTDEQVRSN